MLLLPNQKQNVHPVFQIFIISIFVLDTAFRQQRLPAWRPILTPYNVIPLLIGLGIVFIPLGITFLCTSSKVQEYVFDYTECLDKASDTFSSPSSSNAFQWRKFTENNKSYCQIKFDVAQNMEGPVMMYYRLTNYYQNQRLYVRSVSWEQLRGDPVSKENLGDCSPLVGPDSSELVYYPCGLIANSMFSDGFGDLKSETTSYSFQAKGIAWPSDSNRYGQTKYKLEQIRPPPFWKNNVDLVNSDGTYKKIPELESDERFQVWMRVSGLPTFRKPYGKHTGSIPPGTYSISIDSNFEVKSYGATKSLVISTTSWIGGKNPALGIVYIVTGAIFLLFAIGFLAKHLWRPRALGDTSYLSWLRPSSS